MKTIIRKPRLFKKVRIAHKKKIKWFDFFLILVSLVCIAIAAVLFLVAMPFVLCGVGLILIVNVCNEMRSD